jgi:hypothetical protein
LAALPGGASMSDNGENPEAIARLLNGMSPEDLVESHSVTW